MIVRLVRDVKAIEINQCIHVELLIQTIFRLVFQVKSLYIKIFVMLSFAM